VKDYADKTGLSPADVERVTFVFSDFRNSRPMMFFATSKAFDREKVFGVAVAGGREEKYRGEKIVTNDMEEAGYVLGEKAFVIGSKGDIQSMLDGGKAKLDVDLGPALVEAAKKHLAVVGVSGAGLRRMEADFPRGVGPAQPLFKATAATLVVDVGPSTAGQLRIRFGTEEEAKKGVEAVTFVQKFFEKGLAGSIKEMSEDRSAAGLVKLLATVQKTLEAAEIKRDGGRVATDLQMKLDETMAGAAAVDMVQRIRRAAARAQSTNNLRQIALAMHNYLDTNKSFPPQAVYDKNGKALLSWRVLLLPYLEQNDLYKQFKLDQPWDSPHNKKLLAKMPVTYKTPLGPPQNKFGTFYQGFAGKGAFFEGKRGIGIADITDGTSNTIMIVEAGNDVPWTKPEDLPFDPDKALPRLGVLPGQGFYAAIADGSVRFFRSKVKESSLKKYITRNGGEVIGPDD
jgi:hypothetical protein